MTKLAQADPLTEEGSPPDRKAWKSSKAQNFRMCVSWTFSNVNIMIGWNKCHLQSSILYPLLIGIIRLRPTRDPGTDREPSIYVLTPFNQIQWLKVGFFEENMEPF